jgi:coenzyme PQQ synthesis protein D (PqqD)
MVNASPALPRMKDLKYQEMTINDNSIIVARKNLLCCDLTEGAVILDLDSGTYYGLDDVGAFIWSLIQEPRLFSNIASAVLDEYAVEPERCAADLVELFSEMVQRNLISIRDETIA